MSRNVWLLFAGAVGVLVVVVVALCFWGPSHVVTRTMGGPVAIVQGDPPKHGFLGVDFVHAVVPLTVKNVVQGSGAADAGLQPNDIILAAGAMEKPDLTTLQNLLKTTAPGDQILLKIGRGSNEIEIPVKLISFTELATFREREYSAGP